MLSFTPSSIRSCPKGLQAKKRRPPEMGSRVGNRETWVTRPQPSRVLVPRRDDQIDQVLTTTGVVLAGVMGALDGHRRGTDLAGPPGEEGSSGLTRPDIRCVRHGL